MRILNAQTRCPICKVTILFKMMWRKWSQQSVRTFAFLCGHFCFSWLSILSLCCFASLHSVSLFLCNCFVSLRGPLSLLSIGPCWYLTHYIYIISLIFNYGFIIVLQFILLNIVLLFNEAFSSTASRVSAALRISVPLCLCVRFSRTHLQYWFTFCYFLLCCVLCVFVDWTGTEVSDSRKHLWEIAGLHYKHFNTRACFTLTCQFFC